MLISSLVIAKRAGDAILEIYNSDFTNEYKDDRSPITLADRLSHTIITEFLQDSFPEIPVKSEEGPEDDGVKNNEFFWLVDPLDGTKEFIKRNGEFTVNIALIDQNRPVLGVIYLPVKNIFYFAAKGIGSFKLDQQTIIVNLGKLFNRKEMIIFEIQGFFRELIDNSLKLPVIEESTVITVIGSRSHSSKETEEFIEKLKAGKKEVELISAGSSLKFCLVAEGKAGLYPRFAPTMEWDTAAGQIIVEEAGGTVYDAITNQTLIYKKDKYLNPWFIAANHNNCTGFKEVSPNGNKSS